MRRNGQAIVEALVAITALTVGFLAIVALLSRSLGLYRVTMENYTATYLAAEGVEIAKNLVDSGAIRNNPAGTAPWGTALSAGIYELDYFTDLDVNKPEAFADRVLNFDAATNRYSYGAGTPTRFKRRIAVETVSDREMKVNSVVDWTTRGGAQFSVNVEDHFFDWRGASAGGTGGTGAASSGIYGVNAPPIIADKWLYDERALDQIADARIPWIRIEFPWWGIEIQQQGDFNWPDFDANVNSLVARGYNIVGIIDKTPCWATKGGPTSGAVGSCINRTPDLQKWQAFIGVLVNRYKNRVHVWEIWNEPDLPTFYTGTLAEFRDEILNPGYSAVKTADPSAFVVAPALASYTFSIAQGDAGLTTILSNGGATSLDGVSIHTYQTPDYVMNAGRSARAVMTLFGIGAKPLWLDEFGWDSNPANGGSETTQRDALQSFLSAHAAAPVFDRIFYYTITDPTTAYESSQWLGLLRVVASGYEPKPSYAVYRNWVLGILP